METKTFVTKQFHLWPFYNGLSWKGFFPTYTISVIDNEITVLLNGKIIKKFIPQNIEAVQFLTTWFGMGKFKVVVSVEQQNAVQERVKTLSNDYCYINPQSHSDFIKALQEAQTKCCNEKCLSLRNGKLWMSNEYIVEFNGKDQCAAIKIPDLKYYYTEKSILPWKKPVLVTGSDYPLKIKELSSKDVESLRQYVIANGAKLETISKATFNHIFTFDIIFKPALWFTSSSIGLGDDGVNFMQKTFKTKENIFLPYEKINFVISTGKLASQIFIYGEQNIVPKRKFAGSDARRIVKELREKGVGQFDGERFTESCHSSWFGILFSILTLGIWHVIVWEFSKKRQSIIIGKEMFVWDGNLWLIDIENHIHKKADGNLKILAASPADVVSVHYTKKHWWHWWGYLYICVKPQNIRSDAYEASQSKRKYNLEMGKVFSSTASSIIDLLKAGGFKKDSQQQSKYDEWIKQYIKTI